MGCCSEYRRWAKPERSVYLNRFYSRRRQKRRNHAYGYWPHLQDAHVSYEPLWVKGINRLHIFTFIVWWPSLRYWWISVRHDRGETDFRCLPRRLASITGRHFAGGTITDSTGLRKCDLRWRYIEGRWRKKTASFGSTHHAFLCPEHLHPRQEIQDVGRHHGRNGENVDANIWWLCFCPATIVCHRRCGGMVSGNPLSRCNPFGSQALLCRSFHSCCCFGYVTKKSGIRPSNLWFHIRVYVHSRPEGIFASLGR